MLPNDRLGQIRSFGDGDSMSGLPERYENAFSSGSHRDRVALWQGSRWHAGGATQGERPEPSLLPPPALRERRHRCLARRLVSRASAYGPRAGQRPASTSAAHLRVRRPFMMQREKLTHEAVT